MKPLDLRVKKLLPLTLLAFCAAFLLSGCDLAALLANDTITVTAYVLQSDHTATTDPASYVIVTLNGDSAETQTGYYSGINGLYAVYFIPEFKKLKDGSYTITADYWGKAIVGFLGYAEVSTSIDLPSNGSSDALVSLTFP
ncbi:MAG: hypothetical protein ACLQCB_05175 [Spirochaetia bacterium]